MSKHSSRGKEWEALAQDIKNRDGNFCTYGFLGCTGDKDLTVDHIIPKSKGGADEDWNLRTACRTCNGKKRDNILRRVNWIDREW